MYKRKIGTGVLAVLLMVVMGSSALATVETTNIGSTIDIQTFVDTSIEVCPGIATSSLNFGSITPGTVATPIACHSATRGDIRITSTLASNELINVSITTPSFTDNGDVINISFVDLSETEDFASSINLTDDPLVLRTGFGGLGSNVSIDAYFRLDLPLVFIPAGSYSSTFSVEVTY